MNLLKPSTWFAAEQKQRPAPELFRDLLYGAANTAAGVPVSPDSAMRSTTVLACVRVVAESIAQLPLHVYKVDRNGVRTRAVTQGRQDRIYQVLHSRPNQYQTKFQFVEMMMQHLLLRGNFYALITRNGEGRIQELLPIHPDRVNCSLSDDWTVSYKIRVTNGDPEPVPRERILHVAGMGDGVCGHSLVGWARQAVGYSLAAEEHGARMFSNGAKVGGVLKHSGRLSKEAADRLRDSFERSQSGLENSFKTLVLEEGMAWEPIGMSNSDAQYLDLRKFQRTEICSIFRVPPHKIGDLERATFSNIEHQSLDFVQSALMPWLVRIEKALERDLLTDLEKTIYQIEHNVEGLLRGDTAARYSAYTQALQWGWMSVNEVRAKEGLEPIENGDEHMYPLNMAPLGQPPSPPPADPVQEALNDAVQN